MIQQFDVYPTPMRRDKLERPYVIVVQSPLIDNSSRVCAFLINEKFLNPWGRLNPAFEIEHRRVYFHPIEMITLPRRVLKAPVANLAAERDRLIAALDMAFTGI